MMSGKTYALLFVIGVPLSMVFFSVLRSGHVDPHSNHAVPDSDAEGPATRDVNRKTATIQSTVGREKWHVSEAKSQFDDSRTVVLTLAADNRIKGWLATSTPQLILRCQERKTEVYIATGMPASVEYGEIRRHTVRLRYDDGVAKSMLMTQSTDNQALFFPNPVSNIRRMLSSQTLVVGFTPFNGSPVTIRFDVSDLASAIGPFRGVSRW
jgi:type VI secretion system protein VasI